MGAELVRADIPNLQVQEARLEELQAQFFWQLQADDNDVYSSALSLVQPDHRPFLGENPYAIICMGGFSSADAARSQALMVNFINPSATIRGIKTRYELPVLVAQLYPETQRVVAREGISNPQVDVAVSVMRGLLWAALNDIPDMSPRLDKVETDPLRPTLLDPNRYKL